MFLPSCHGSDGEHHGSNDGYRGSDGESRFRRVGNRGFGFPGQGVPTRTCMFQEPTYRTRFAACGVQAALCTRAACLCCIQASVCCTTFCACCTRSSECSKKFFACDCCLAGDCAGSTPCGTTSRPCDIATSLRGTHLSLHGSRSSACIPQTGNRGFRTAGCGHFPCVCGIENCVRTTDAFDRALARCVASIARAFRITSGSASAIAARASQHRPGTLPGRQRFFTLAHKAHAPSSQTRRRAFSSGLSHAKCPKPGFRSNVFG